MSALVVLAAALAAPARAAGPRPVVTADLRRRTTITWSGHAGINLRVPADATLSPRSSFRITSHGAHYVSVRAFDFPFTGGCGRRVAPVCMAFWVDWLDDLARTSGHANNRSDPTRDYLYAMSDPPILRRGSVDLYLFTDGVATIEIDSAGLTGSAAYRAVGRFDGQARLGHPACGVGQCVVAPHAYAVSGGGGDAFDLGEHGFYQALAFGGVADPHGPDRIGQSFSLAACAYPNDLNSAASPDPARHPDGCDTVSPEAPIDAMLTNADAWANATDPVAMRARYAAGSHVASGKVYLGFRVGSYGVLDPRVGGLLIWLRYGIR